MKKLIILLSAILGVFGLGYVFIEPSFKVGKIDGTKQAISFEFDGKNYIYYSGVSKPFSVSSRGYKLEIADSVVGIGSIAITGSIKVKITQSNKEVQSYEIKPSEHGFYLWNWKKTL